MKNVRYVYWQDGEMWIGYLEEYPDYMTQGESVEELQENLKDIYEDLTGGSTQTAMPSSAQRTSTCDRTPEWMTPLP